MGKGRKRYMIHESTLPPTSLCALPPGRARSKGLLSERWLGNVPVVRGPAPGHPDRSFAATKVLGGNIPGRAEGSALLHRARASRLRLSRARERAGSNQISAPGAFCRSTNTDFDLEGPLEVGRQDFEKDALFS